MIKLLILLLQIYRRYPKPWLKIVITAHSQLGLACNDFPIGTVLIAEEAKHNGFECYLVRKNYNECMADYSWGSHCVIYKEHARPYTVLDIIKQRCLM